MDCSSTGVCGKAFSPALGAYLENGRRISRRDGTRSYSRSMRITCARRDDRAVGEDGLQRLAHKMFAGRVRDEDHAAQAIGGGGRPVGGAALEPPARSDIARPPCWTMLSSEMLRSAMRVGDAGEGARHVAHGQADVIAALVPAHAARALQFGESADGRPNGAERTPLAMSAMSATTAEAVASPPAPGPTSVSSCTASASMVTALSTPMTCAIA